MGLSGVHGAEYCKLYRLSIKWHIDWIHIGLFIRNIVIPAGDNLRTGGHPVHMGNKYIPYYTITGKIQCDSVFPRLSGRLGSIAAS